MTRYNPVQPPKYRGNTGVKRTEKPTALQTERPPGGGLSLPTSFPAPIMVAISQKTFKSTFTYEHKRAARHFVSCLKQLLKNAELSPKDFHEITGVPTRTLQSWLSGEALPPRERIAVVV